MLVKVQLQLCLIERVPEVKHKVLARYGFISCGVLFVILYSDVGYQVIEVA
jgi:hypothetical protein